MFNEQISALIADLVSREGEIPEERKSTLHSLAEAIYKLKQETGKAKVTVICTHNSRRSQLGQLWIKVAAQYHGVKDVFTFSGGTEATAFNKRMVDAITSAGFPVRCLEDGTNPKYHIAFDNENLDILYSKKFDESYNPQEAFIAVMVCTSADEGCPFVPGSFARISLPYDDPKEFDDTELEASKYAERLEEIGRDMLYVVAKVKQLQNQ